MQWLQHDHWGNADFQSYIQEKSLVFVSDRLRLETTRWIDHNATDRHILVKNWLLVDMYSLF